MDIINDILNWIQERAAYNRTYQKKLIDKRVNRQIERNNRQPIVFDGLFPINLTASTYIPSAVVSKPKTTILTQSTITKPTKVSNKSTLSDTVNTTKTPNNSTEAVNTVQSETRVPVSKYSLDKTTALTRQNEMIDAMNNGWNYTGTFFGKKDGTADGLWGKNSEAAWKEYEKYKLQLDYNKNATLKGLQSTTPFENETLSKITSGKVYPAYILDTDLNITGNNRSNLSPTDLGEVRARAFRTQFGLDQPTYNKFGGKLNYFDII